MRDNVIAPFLLYTAAAAAAQLGLSMFSRLEKTH